MIARKHALWALPGVHDEAWQVPRLSCAATSSRQFGITLVWVPYGQQLENVVNGSRMRGGAKYGMEDVMPLFDASMELSAPPDVETLYGVGSTLEMRARR